MLGLRQIAIFDGLDRPLIERVADKLERHFGIGKLAIARIVELDPRDGCAFGRQFGLEEVAGVRIAAAQHDRLLLELGNRKLGGFGGSRPWRPAPFATA